MNKENRIVAAIEAQPFDLRHVKLGQSQWKNQFDELVLYFKSLPSDDILRGFRRRASLPDPGRELGGWYSYDNGSSEFDEVFNTFGQWLSGLARLYAITNDPELLDKVKYLVDEWGKTIEEDGYFYYTRNCNAHHYVYEKIVCGLVDILHYCKYTPAEGYLKKITEWAMKNLCRDRLPATPPERKFYPFYMSAVGGSPNVYYTDNEWYTLSENLYRAYLFTGDPIYKDFAQVWHYTTYWEALAAGKAESMTFLHAYSHVNTLSGAAMAYQVTGEDHYLQTITTAYELLKKHQWMASGGYGPGEKMAPPNSMNGEELLYNAATFEVPCGSWAGFKLSRYLIACTGRAEYGDWAERLLYNAIGSALPMKDDEIRRGKTFYYADYRLNGGRKNYAALSYPCCSGTFPQAVSDYYNLVYFHADRCLYVNLFLPSEVQFDIGGIPVRIVQETDFPASDRINFQISSQDVVVFSLRIRVPEWTEREAINLHVNGQPVETVIDEQNWINIEQVWCPNDRIELQLPMHLRFEAIDPAHPRRAALMIGPVMLAMISQNGGALKGSFSRPERWIEPVVGEPLHFQVNDINGIDRKFVPFFEIGERARYYIYNDIEEL